MRSSRVNFALVKVIILHFENGYINIHDCDLAVVYFTVIQINDHILTVVF